MEHSQSKCHRDAVILARMAEQGKEQSVLQLQCSAAAKEAEERRAKNRNIVLKLLRSIYFLAKKSPVPYNHIRSPGPVANCKWR